MLRILGCITSQHDWRLLVPAGCICLLGCLTTASLLAAASRPGMRRSFGRVLAAALVFGSSVWSLHFIAMLAFLPGVQDAYEIRATASSIVIAWLGALAAFAVWSDASTGRFARVMVAGAALGASVAAMHYTGVQAMRLPARISFDPGFVALSVALGIGFTTLGLARAGTLSRLRQRLELAFWLTLGICGLHFTGMSAMAIEIGFPEDARGAVFGSVTLAVTVAMVTLMILVLGLAASYVEQQLAARAVQELARLRRLSDLAREVIVIHRDGVVLEVNSAGTRLFGRPAAAFAGIDVAGLFAPECLPALEGRLRCAPDARQAEELEILTAAGQRVPVELSCQGIDFAGRPATAVALRDLSDRKRQEARIRHLAHHDALTDLPNRSLLHERLGQAIDSAAQDGTGTALLYLDLDGFKPVNDLLGHAAGDALLVEVSRRLQAEIRSTDTLARVGGDEFVVVLGGMSQPEGAARLAERLTETLGRTFEVAGQPVAIGASIGIAMCPADGDSREALLRAADTAMYRLKEDGGGGFRFFESSMDAQLQERRRFEHDLRHAVLRGELRLDYQPQVNCQTGETEGFEALLRWEHPERGLISPAEFIPLAEETGLIVRIGQWVLDTACEAAAAWPEPWRVSVNVSPVQFRHADLPHHVAQALSRTGLPASRLEIEITESVFIRDVPRATQVLEALRQQGVRLSLDDFGTGYSSLSYLRLFPFDDIKIDKSFVKEMTEDTDSAAIVSSIIQLGHNLGLSITVEGVETAQQLAMVREQGADKVQGYLLGRPAAPDAFSASRRARVRSMLRNEQDDLAVG